MHLSWRQNLGSIDRTIRIAVGLVLFYMAAFRPIPLSGFVSGLFWIIGAFMFIEGALGY